MKKLILVVALAVPALAFAEDFKECVERIKDQVIWKLEQKCEDGKYKDYDTTPSGIRKCKKNVQDTADSMAKMQCRANQSE